MGVKRDFEKDVESWIHRLHCWFFDDDEWGLDDYIDLYGPFVLLLIVFGLICLVGLKFG